MIKQLCYLKCFSLEYLDEENRIAAVAAKHAKTLMTKDTINSSLHAYNNNNHLRNLLKLLPIAIN